MELPSKIFNWGEEGVELHEEEDRFVLTVEMPGFEKDEIQVNFYEGRLNVSAEHEDDDRGRRKRYHRTFRLPKKVEPENINATYRNGVLEIALPIERGVEARGHQIEVE